MRCSILLILNQLVILSLDETATKKRKATPVAQRYLRFEWSSILLGLTIDVFSNSYGAHTFSSVLIGYLKIKWIDKKYIADADDMFEFIHFSMDRFIINSFIIILIHHFSLFFLERFSFNEFFSVLSITLISSIFTLILFIIHKVCSPKKS